MYVHRADLMNGAASEALVESVRPSHLLHLAWYTTPRRFGTSDRNVAWVEASFRLLRAFAGHGGVRAVVTGTCAEYDWRAGRCSEESTPRRPSSLYGVCKNALFEVATAHARSAGHSLAWDPGLLFMPRDRPALARAAMIVSQRFVWGHVPKTGGDATATMIARVPRLVLLADDLGDDAKHLSFDKRRGSIKGKLLVANIRRLPDWAISAEQHYAYHGVWPDYEPVGRQPAHAVASRDNADRALAMVVGDYEVDRWLRQEHLVDDLVDFLRKIAALTAAEERAIRSVGRVNVHRARLRRWRLRSPKRFFTPAQIDELYANNPRWAAIERRVYG